MNTETMRFRSGEPGDPMNAFQIDYYGTAICNFLSAVSVMLEKGIATTADATMNYSPLSAQDVRHVGYRDEYSYYFHPGVLYRMVTKTWPAIFGGLDLPKTFSIYQTLAAAGIIERKNTGDGAFTEKLRIYGKEMKVVRIPRRCIDYREGEETAP